MLLYEILDSKALIQLNGSVVSRQITHHFLFILVSKDTILTCARKLACQLSIYRTKTSTGNVWRWASLYCFQDIISCLCIMTYVTSNKPWTLLPVKYDRTYNPSLGYNVRSFKIVKQRIIATDRFLGAEMTRQVTQGHRNSSTENAWLPINVP